MSIEAVKEFYERITNDEEFQNKLNELQDKATEDLELPLVQDKKEEMVKDVIIPFAKEQGFDFSIEDIKEFEQSIVEQLDEEQLKDISAAGNFLPVGTGATICKVIGIGLLGFSNDRHSWGFCCLLGFGLGAGACAIVGVSSY